MPRTSYLLPCLLSLLCLATPSLASPTEELQQLCVQHPELCEKRSRFLPHEPSYAIYNFTEDDESALEAHYSFKYLFNSTNCLVDYKFAPLDVEQQIACIEKNETRQDLYFKYTGRFDFYVGTRSSGPVINRISNPALHLRQYLPKESNHNANNRFIDFMSRLLVHRYWSVRHLDLGLFEHRSNGQVVDADDRVTDPGSSDFGRYKTQIAFENDDHEYFDSLSRGANYLSLEAPLNLGRNHGRSDCSYAKDCFEVLLAVKPLYYTNDSNVTWGALAGSDTEISDYDRFKVQLSDTLFFSKKKTEGDNDKRFRIEYRLEWVLGDELLDTDSLNASLHIPLFIKEWKIPLYIKGHTGPMKTLANYTKEQDSIGVGVIFK